MSSSRTSDQLLKAFTGLLLQLSKVCHLELRIDARCPEIDVINKAIRRAQMEKLDTFTVVEEKLNLVTHTWESCSDEFFANYSNPGDKGNQYPVFYPGGSISGDYKCRNRVYFLDEQWIEPLGRCGREFWDESTVKVFWWGLGNINLASIFSLISFKGSHRGLFMLKYQDLHELDHLNPWQYPLEDSLRVFMDCLYCNKGQNSVRLAGSFAPSNTTNRYFPYTMPKHIRTSLAVPESKKLAISRSGFPDSFQGNFQGAKMLVATKNSPIHTPFSGIRKGTLNEPVISGVCSELLKLFQSRLNFTYEVFVPALDQQEDSDDEISNLSPIIDAALGTDFDIILAPVVATKENRRRVKITAPYYIDDFVMIVNMQQEYSLMWTYVQVLPIDVRILLLTSFLATFLLMLLLDSKQIQLRIYGSFAKPKEPRWLYMMRLIQLRIYGSFAKPKEPRWLYMMRLVCLQGPPETHMPVKTLERCAQLVTWTGFFFFGLLYQSALESNFFVPAYPEPINSLDSFRKEGLKLLISRRGGDGDALLTHIPYFVQNRVYASEAFPGMTRQAVLQTRKHQFGMIRPRNELVLRLRDMLRCNMKDYPLHVVKENVQQFTASLGFQKASKLLPIIDQMILEADAAGMLKYWTNTAVLGHYELEDVLSNNLDDSSYMSAKTTAFTNPNVQLKPITLAHLESAFLLYFVGCLVSLLTFLYERRSSA
ncbi:unnamed protein product [Notodromas monacha]|uniref:Ionotropic receptor n=2 Tax=Notodromas monacha TaxID=399045 RepID=A0A7R9BRV8_9CRUS|nr:unnamed protein product [Notodromas monacha]CAG0919652.1 unnamed protein product [Notodromas monacha]